MIEILVGLNVINEQGYRNYRDQMKPLLNKMGGGFRYDFIISKECDLDISERFKVKMDKSTINRLFIIFFPDANIQNKFFEHQDYLHLKQKYFEPSVASTTIIAEWNSN